jgi:hypothetical protein
MEQQQLQKKNSINIIVSYFEQFYGVYLISKKFLLKWHSFHLSKSPDVRFLCTQIGEVLQIDWFDYLKRQLLLKTSQDVQLTDNVSSSGLLTTFLMKVR